jgi:hypothetical protein
LDLISKKPDLVYIELVVLPKVQKFWRELIYRVQALKKFFPIVKDRVFVIFDINWGLCFGNNFIDIFGIEIVLG